jgi:hypothetical protein
MQVDGAAKARRPDPSKAAGPTWLPMPPAPEAGAINHPVPRGNPLTGRINPFPFLWRPQTASPLPAPEGPNSSNACRRKPSIAAASGSRSW